MPEQTVAAVWQIIAYAEAAVITALAGVIVKMVHWFIKVERPRLATVFEDIANKNEARVDRNTKALNATAGYLKDIYRKMKVKPPKRPEDVDGTIIDFNSARDA